MKLLKARCRSPGLHTNVQTHVCSLKVEPDQDSLAIERDFGTDYGICCWYTPQINFTEIDIHTKENNLHEPDWGQWFMNVPKVSFVSCSRIL